MPDKLKFKVVPLKPRKEVPADAEPLTVAKITEQVPLEEQIMASIDRLERMMLNFSKSINDLGRGLDYTEARLNRVVRLTKTLATLAGIPD